MNTDQPFCIMFAGQSVQESGMGRNILKNPIAQEIFHQLIPSLGQDLEYLLTEMPDEELAKTFNSQRAIHASHLAHWFAYKALHPDIKLNGALGHSMGIVAALVAAEAITLQDSGKLIAARAKAFSDCCKTFKEPMGLAAVSTDDFNDVVDTLNEVKGVELALWNTIGRGTLGGTICALENYARHAREQDWPIKIKILPVEGPYHTKAFAPAQAPLLKVLEKINIRTPTIPVFMGTSGFNESDPKRIRDLLLEQVVAYERHLEAVSHAYQFGCQQFLEVSFKPQPIHWLKEQLIDADNANPFQFKSLLVHSTELI